MWRKDRADAVLEKGYFVTGILALTWQMWRRSIQLIITI